MKNRYLPIVLSFITLNISAQNYGFTPAPDFYSSALGRDDASVFVIGDSAFVGLGTRSDYSLGNDFYVFNEHTNSWSVCASLPMLGRQYTAAFTINGKGYLMGGVGLNDFRYNDVWVYEPSTNTWAPEQTFPATKRQGVQTAVYNNIAYCFFGRDSAGYLGEVWKFNGNVWQQTTAFPDDPRYLSTHVQFGDDVFFFCGYNGTNLMTETWKFNLQTETWAHLTDFPGDARWYGRGFVFEDKIYMGTGWGGTDFLDDFWSYEPSSQTWQQMDNFPGGARKGMATFMVNGRAFIGMGAKQTGERDKLIWEFVPNVGIYENTQLSNLQLYPNPTSDYLNINASEQKLTHYNVLDLQGKTLLSGNLHATANAQIDIQNLSNGMYILFTRTDKDVCKNKFIVKH